MFRRLCVCLLVLAPGMGFAASKEIQELQRDIAQLQDMVKQLQRSQDEKLAALQTLVQQSLNASNDANKTVAIIQNGLRENIQEQQAKIVAPVVGLTGKLDSMGNDFRTLQGAVTELTGLINKIQTQLTDLNNNVKVMQQPAAAPPPAVAPSPGAGDSASATPSMSATDLIAAANRDRGDGKLEFALQEYAEYLKFYGNTALAPEAQFYIGFIYYGNKDYEKAVNAFDAVLEKYSTDKVRTPQAYFYKGKSLAALGRKTDASTEFKDLMRLFPNHDLSKQACTELQGLGYRCSVPRAAAPAKSPAKAPAKASARRKR
jgi:TolA-binding protein